MAPFCCTQPERSHSPVPPNRPANLDQIFTVTSLPYDHPHAIHIERPPSVDQTLIRSPSIVSKLKSHLQRKSTIKSLKSQMYDADPGMLTSEEVLDCLESDEMRGHDRSPSSSYSTEDMLAICRVFDGVAEAEEKDKESNHESTPQESTPQVMSEPSSAAERPIDDKAAPTATGTRQLSLPHLSPTHAARSSVGRSSTTRTLSTLQPPGNGAGVASPPSDTANTDVPVVKGLLTPGGESLADYERKLSVCGDDRRWGASCDPQKYAEIKEEDQQAKGLMARMRAKRATSRASNVLMESALERQLQEKSLFRSPSKLEDETPSFVTTAWSGASHHDDDGELDPLDDCLLDPNDPKCRKKTPPREPPESWCRWSSYDRGSRAGAAGIEDDMHVRDFATPLPYADRGHLTNPTMTKLKNVKRYYTDLFTTSGFHGKGHRTSIWGSGKLRDPELEMLPPSMPTYSDEDPPDWVEGKRCSLPSAKRASVPEKQGPTSEARRVSSAPVEDNQREAPAQSDGANDMSAQQLSEMYSDCVVRPFSPVKITRYPSATVIDDREGHWRSVSLVSEKSFFRESSNDLLKLVEREKERCEQLIMG